MMVGQEQTVSYQNANYGAGHGLLCEEQSVSAPRAKPSTPTGPTLGPARESTVETASLAHQNLVPGPTVPDTELLPKRRREDERQPGAQDDKVHVSRHHPKQTRAHDNSMVQHHAAVYDASAMPVVSMSPVTV